MNELFTAASALTNADYVPAALRPTKEPAKKRRARK